MIKKIRFLFLPLAWIHQIIIRFRNFLFDRNILKSATFNFPLICVGNLALGGTGKTPMVELLVEMLGDDFELATLSRGYKRKTKGFAIANDRTTAIEIGDEPMQFHQKFPDLTVAVGEERIVAIPQILHLRPRTDVIILDDAFQHRAVKAGLNILLTEQKNLYVNDQMFPAGDLRDIPGSASRADVIVVTKCDPNLTEDKAAKIAKQLNPTKNQQLFFAKLSYRDPYHLFSKQKTALDKEMDVILVCGIANPAPLVSHLLKITASVKQLRYPDHHIFKTEDLKEIKSVFDALKSQNKIVLTTEKDAVRLAKYEPELGEFPVYVLPVGHEIMFNAEYRFKDICVSFIESFPTTGIELENR